MKVVELARAKVNLALHVLARRADGYHELDSIVAFADVGDDLTFAPAPSFKLEVSGPFARDLCEDDGNLVMRAANALVERWPHLVGPARITLCKNLPVASGIGGGSADAAATLRGLLRLFEATIDRNELAELALRLGADVPVCLEQKACRLRGIGETIDALEPFQPMPAILVNPLEPVATVDVFRRLGLKAGQSHALPIEDPADCSNWRNDLEVPAMVAAPVIRDVLDCLRGSRNPSHVSMSGSGATCYAAFASRQDAEAAARSMPQEWWSAVVQLS